MRCSVWRLTVVRTGDILEQSPTGDLIAATDPIGSFFIFLCLQSEECVVCLNICQQTEEKERSTDEKSRVSDPVVSEGGERQKRVEEGRKGGRVRQTERERDRRERERKSKQTGR
jgi:hypothetical protein